MLQINLKPDEVEKIESHAKDQGYPTIEDWLRAIAQDETDEEDKSVEDILADLTQGFSEALRGEVITMEELRRRIDQRPIANNQCPS